MDNDLVRAEISRLEAELAETKSLAESRNDQLEANRLRHINDLADMHVEIGRLKGENERMTALFDIEKQTHEFDLQRIAALKNELERLEVRFPCGHRKIDWDDSYGECAVCQCKEMATAYDNLPRDVIACHDKIAALEAALKATARASYVDGTFCWCYTSPLSSTAAHNTVCTQARAAVAAGKLVVPQTVDMVVGLQKPQG